MLKQRIEKIVQNYGGKHVPHERLIKLGYET